MYKMKNIGSVLVLTFFVILAVGSDDSGSSSSSLPYDDSPSSGSSYKESSSRTCQTCGYDYYSLPYKGQYCSSSCCKVWSELGDPGCGSW